MSPQTGGADNLHLTLAPMRLTDSRQQLAENAPEPSCATDEGGCEPNLYGSLDNRAPGPVQKATAGNNGSTKGEECNLLAIFSP